MSDINDAAASLNIDPSLMAEIEAIVPEETPENQLERIRERARELREIDLKLAEEQADIKQLTERRRSLVERILPELFTSAQITELVVDNIRLKREQSVHGSVPKTELDKRRELLNFLIDSGNGGMIKRQISVELPKGDKAMELKVLEAIEAVSDSLRPQVEETIHANSYAAFARKVVKEGKDYPLDKLNIFIRDVVDIA